MDVAFRPLVFWAQSGLARGRRHRWEGSQLSPGPSRSEAPNQQKRFWCQGLGLRPSLPDLTHIRVFPGPAGRGAEPGITEQVGRSWESRVGVTKCGSSGGSSRGCAQRSECKQPQRGRWPSELPVALVLGDTGNSSCPRGLQPPFLQHESASVPRRGGVFGLQVPAVGRERNVLCEPLGQASGGHTCLHLLLAAD